MPEHAPAATPLAERHVPLNALTALVEEVDEGDVGKSA
jgi:hypothetical protein